MALIWICALHPAAATAGDFVINVSRQEPSDTQTVLGPARIYFVGINPFLYDWSAAVDEVPVQSPALPFSSNDQSSPTVTPGQNSQVSESLTTLRAGSDPFDSADFTIEESDAQDGCMKPTGDTLANCIDKASRNVGELRNELAKDTSSIASARSSAEGLMWSANTLLAGGEFLTQQSRDVLRSKVETTLLKRNGADPYNVPAVADAIANVSPWPVQKIAALADAFNRFDGAITDEKSFPPGRFSRQRAIVSEDVRYLKTLAPTGYIATHYQALRNQLQSFKSSRLANISYGRFIFESQEQCNGLTSGGLKKTVTVSLSEKMRFGATIVCDSRLIVSSGVAFSRLEQRTFGSVPANVAGIPAPKPQSTAPPATIVEQNFSSVRPIAIAFANVRLFDREPQSLLRNIYASFGLTLNSSSNYSNIDYAGGISYAIGKTLFLTGGYHLGYEDFPAPGYSAGNFIANGSNPQTLQRRRTAPFFGVSFGR